MIFTVKDLLIEEKPSIVVASDFHFPYEDNNAVLLFLEYLRSKQPENVVLNGDVFDFYQLSRFDQDPTRKGKLQEDIDRGVSFLRQVRGVLPRSTIYYCQGNHEERLTKYLKRNPGLWGLTALNPEELFHLNHLKIQWIPESIELGGWRLTHGVSLATHSALAARKEFDRWRSNGASGHTHRLGAYFHTTPAGTFTWLEGGSMCDQHPEYVTGTPNWQLGWTELSYGSNDFKIYPIINGCGE
jgi:predicted phosphodiesterase